MKRKEKELFFDLCRYWDQAPEKLRNREKNELYRRPKKPITGCLYWRRRPLMAEYLAQSGADLFLTKQRRISYGNRMYSALIQNNIWRKRNENI